MIAIVRHSIVRYRGIQRYHYCGRLRLLTGYPRLGSWYVLAPGPAEMMRPHQRAGRLVAFEGYQVRLVERWLRQNRLYCLALGTILLVVEGRASAPPGCLVYKPEASPW